MSDNSEILDAKMYKKLVHGSCKIVCMDSDYILYHDDSQLYVLSIHEDFEEIDLNTESQYIYPLDTPRITSNFANKHFRMTRFVSNVCDHKIVLKHLHNLKFDDDGFGEFDEGEGIVSLYMIDMHLKTIKHIENLQIVGYGPDIGLDQSYIYSWDSSSTCNKKVSKFDFDMIFQDVLNLPESDIEQPMGYYEPPTIYFDVDSNNNINIIEYYITKEHYHIVYDNTYIYYSIEDDELQEVARYVFKSRSDVFSITNGCISTITDDKKRWEPELNYSYGLDGKDKRTMTIYDTVKQTDLNFDLLSVCKLCMDPITTTDIYIDCASIKSNGVIFCIEHDNSKVFYILSYTYPKFKRVINRS